MPKYVCREEHVAMGDEKTRRLITKTGREELRARVGVANISETTRD